MKSETHFLQQLTRRRRQSCSSVGGKTSECKYARNDLQEVGKNAEVIKFHLLRIGSGANGDDSIHPLCGARVVFVQLLTDQLRKREASCFESTPKALGEGISRCNFPQVELVVK